VVLTGYIGNSSASVAQTHLASVADEGDVVVMGAISF
jgi:hypothetical protein